MPRKSKSKPAKPVAPPQRLHIDRRAASLVEDASDADGDDLLTTRETAAWLQVSEPWLEIGRTRGYGPPYERLAPRVIRYRRGTVRQWLQERSHRSTAEYNTATPRPAA